ncbi:MAG: DUF4381 domain-containing protein [Gammaproteobacteria bacterium]|nr:DUF4381 domain-containing protein [Gammaproteobacteria bacterium]
MDPEQLPLRDLHLPETIGWWPLAPGWWLFIGVALIGAAILLRRYLQTRARGAARRHALRQLDQLLTEYEQHRNVVRFGAEVSSLLRRAMLAYAPREEVAGLTGDAWLAWLDRDLAHPQFVSGPGRKLIEIPYRNPDSDVTDADVYALVTAVRQRVATPPGGQP